jgi:ArsR family transcriptional regulator
LSGDITTANCSCCKCLITFFGTHFFTRTVIDNIRLCGYFVFMKTEAKIFKALADETRLRILSLLLDGELCVCELIAALELPQSTISRHLAYLRKSGLVKDRRQGVRMYYRFNPDGHALIRGLKAFLEQFIAGTDEHAQAFRKLRRFQNEQKFQTC